MMLINMSYLLCMTGLLNSGSLGDGMYALYKRGSKVSHIETVVLGHKLRYQKPIGLKSEPWHNRLKTRMTCITDSEIHNLYYAQYDSKVNPGFKG